MFELKNCAFLLLVALTVVSEQAASALHVTTAPAAATVPNPETPVESTLLDTVSEYTTKPKAKHIMTYKNPSNILKSILKRVDQELASLNKLHVKESDRYGKACGIKKDYTKHPIEYVHEYVAIMLGKPRSKEFLALDRVKKKIVETKAIRKRIQHELRIQTAWNKLHGSPAQLQAHKVAKNKEAILKITAQEKEMKKAVLKLAKNQAACATAHSLAELNSNSGNSELDEPSGLIHEPHEREHAARTHLRALQRKKHAIETEKGELEATRLQ